MASVRGTQRTHPLWRRSYHASQTWPHLASSCLDQARAGLRSCWASVLRERRLSLSTPTSLRNSRQPSCSQLARCNLVPTTIRISARPGRRRPPFRTLIYPSIHVSIHWARTAHRLAGVQVPDVPLRALKRVEETTNISFTVGGLEDFDGEGLEDFHAVATCFVLDVFADMRRSLRILRAMLQRHGGLWINLGPFAFPEPNEGHVGASPRLNVVPSRSRRRSRCTLCAPPASRCSRSGWSKGASTTRCPPTSSGRFARASSLWPGRRQSGSLMTAS